MHTRCTRWFKLEKEKKIWAILSHNIEMIICHTLRRERGFSVGGRDIVTLLLYISILWGIGGFEYEGNFITQIEISKYFENSRYFEGKSCISHRSTSHTTDKYFMNLMSCQKLNMSYIFFLYKNKHSNIALF